MSQASDPKISSPDSVRDPVCGKVVDPLRARAVGIYNGVTHYFCSPECKASFGDPRTKPTVPNAGPGGTERRFTETQPSDVASAESGRWFARPELESAPISVDRFHDLEGARPMPLAPPSPSILLEVDAVKPKRGLYIAIGIVVAVVFFAIVAVLSSHSG